MRKARIGLRGRLQRVVGDDELQPLHGLQAVLEGFAGLDEVAKGVVVVGLDGEGGIVGGGIEEGGFGKVEEDWRAMSVLCVGLGVWLLCSLLLECRKPPIIWT